MLKKLILIIIAIFLIPVAAEQIQTLSSASKTSEQEQSEEEPIHSALMLLPTPKPMIRAIQQKNLMRIRRPHPMILSLKIPVKQKIKKKKKNLAGNPGMKKFFLHVKDYFQIENDTECSLKDLDLDGIPELHIVTNGGADGLLGNAVIFYYDDNHNLQSTEYEYAWQSAPSPRLYTNSNGEKWTGKKPSKFYAFGEIYNNTDDFLEQIRSKWTWKPVSADYDSLSVNPGYPDLSQGEIDQLLDSYRPLI